MVLTKKLIDSYLNEFKEMTGAEIPAKGLAFFQEKQYENLDKKNIAGMLEGYFMDEDPVLEMDLAKMIMLIDFSNDGYFDQEHVYLPLAALADQTCYIGIRAGDESAKVYFFDYQEGYIEQEYTLDGLLEMVK